MTSAAVYWQTLRHLKPVQIYARIWFRVYRPKPDLSLAPSLRTVTGMWSLPARRETSMVGPVKFHFLNETHPLKDIGWNNPEREKLWLYNLHYFDDLNAHNAATRRGWHELLLRRWVNENPPASGNGWEPYPTSLRIVNWIKWSLSGNILPHECISSLSTQARWLNKRLEWHLLGNHLFANAKALVYSGLFFYGEEAEGWLKKGLSIISAELPEQVLADGGNFERSTMYHAIFLEDVLDLINLACTYSGRLDEKVVKEWRDAADRMLGWMAGMLHPDGQIAFFNDAAFDIAPEPIELVQYAKRLGVSGGEAELKSKSTLQLQSWPESGYVRMSSPSAVALLDVAPVGPDYLPGHAHADTLSFELSVFGQRVVVNGGTSCYGRGARRLEERQTRSHSTVEVGALSSSEVWDGFRVARRAHPFDLNISRRNELLSVVCSHDGYTHLSGRPVHRREWRMNNEGLSVIDRVVGGQHAAVARYVLHPDIQATELEKKEWMLTLRPGQNVRIKVISGNAELERGNYAPEFGKVLSTNCLAITLVDYTAHMELIWT